MSNSFKRTVYGIGYLGTDETGRPMRTVDETGKATNVATGETIEFDSIRQASREIKSNGTDRTREKKIGECLNGKSKSAYGYYWEYVE